MKKPLILAMVLLAAATLSTRAADVKEIWDKQCTKCHGPDGKGDTKLGKKAGVKDMTTAEYQANLKDDKAFKSVKEGMKEGDKIVMKPIEGASDADIKALVAYVRSFKK